MNMFGVPKYTVNIPLHEGDDPPVVEVGKD
jgi:hypothetical protein